METPSNHIALKQVRPLLILTFVDSELHKPGE
jgi:hypothetical protein